MCKIIVNKDYMPHQSIVFTTEKHLNDFSYNKVAIAYQMRNQYGGNNKAIWELEIHPTNICNLNCNGCSYATRHNSNTLAIEKLIKVLDSYNTSDLRCLFFSGGGDPLLWNYWDRFFFTINKNCNYGISTNLYNFNSIISWWKMFDFYQIHITGYDKESCLKFTGNDSFSKINNNISYVLQNKLSHQNITLKWMINSQNYNKLDCFLDYVFYSEADSIVIKIQQDFLHNYDYATDELLKTIREIAYSHSISSKYDYLLDNLDDIVYNTYEKPSSCLFAYSGLYRLINAEGDMFPCIASNYCKNNRIGSDSKLSSIYTENMINGRCPLKACRHYRFSQYLNCVERVSLENNIPILL